MMIRFTRTDDRFIWVNPSHIRFVEQYGDSDTTLIGFTADHFFIVTGGVQNIINQIDKAQKQ